ncbi:MAG: SDR family oxidoreductase [Bacilli bacterium]|nr:SDR family oxidoreductase [Bacilli bacterium]
MKALITGASSGIGRDMARVLSEKGYDLILVARRKNRLEKLQKELKTNVDIITMDISTTFNCLKLYNKVKKENIDILINNAGVGVFGEFTKTKIDDELDLIDLNIKALHTLTKLFLKDFKERNHGYILNVSSSAAFLPGPLMATYYSSKAYILQLSASINEELRRDNSNVYIGVLCPGPVNTEFNKVAKVKFNMKALESYDVAEYGIKRMLKREFMIIPGFKMKASRVFTKILPINLLARISYNIQKRKDS